MAQSIGDLFVKLGFDVDDQKLRGFEQDVKSVFNTLLGLAGITASAAGLYELGKGAAETQVQWRNFNAELGGSLKTLQEFSALYKTVNPFSSLQQGQTVAGNLINYANRMIWGEGGREYGYFGGNASDFINPATGQFDPNFAIPNILRRLRQGEPQALAIAGGNRAKVTEWEAAIAGSPDIVNVLHATSAQRSEAEKLLTLEQEQEDATVKATEALSQLQLRWDNFVNHAIATLAPKALGFMDTVSQKGLWAGVGWIGEHSYLPGLVDWAGEHSFLPSIHSVNHAISNAVHGNIWNTGTTNGKTIMAQLISMGWSPAQATGILRRLNIESGLNPGAIGDNGQAYGIAQWHPDRQAAFARWAGHSIIGSNLSEQLGFMNYELTQGGESRAGSILRRMGSPDAAYDAFTRYYERPASSVNNTITINVQSNADANEVGQIVADHFRRVIGTTYPTKNAGGY